jgi:hypothetical protein
MKMSFRKRLAGFAQKVLIVNPADSPIPTRPTAIGTVNIRTQAGQTVDVFIQDQSTDTVDYLMTQTINTVTLASNTILGSRDIELSGVHGVVVGNIIELTEGNRFYQGEVVTVVADDITLDTPLDYAFTTAATGARTNASMNVNGSVTAQIFDVSPPAVAGVRWDVTRMIVNIQDNDQMDTGAFGGLAKLTNGVVIRQVNGVRKNQFNIKTNGEWAERSFDIGYDDKAPAGTFGFRCRRTWGGQDKNGVVIRLDGSAGGAIQHIVQDNLTGLTEYRIVIHGHVVED